MAWHACTWAVYVWHGSWVDDPIHPTISFVLLPTTEKKSLLFKPSSQSLYLAVSVCFPLYCARLYSTASISVLSAVSGASFEPFLCFFRFVSSILRSGGGETLRRIFVVGCVLCKCGGGVVRGGEDLRAGEEVVCGKA